MPAHKTNLFCSESSQYMKYLVSLTSAFWTSKGQIIAKVCFFDIIIFSDLNKYLYKGSSQEILKVSNF